MSNNLKSRLSYTSRGCETFCSGANPSLLAPGYGPARPSLGGYGAVLRGPQA